MSRLRPSLRGHATPIGGKSLRDSRNGIGTTAHLVPGVGWRGGRALGQVKTTDKSNEIVAIL
jgi:hypothetical protein